MQHRSTLSTRPNSGVAIWLAPIPQYLLGVTDPDYLSTTRSAYDATVEMYTKFAGNEITTKTEGPIDRAFLEAFVEYVAASRSKRVADLGCGPGRAAAFLKRKGLDPIGFDLSSSMVAAARAAHPGIEFEEGLLSKLPLPDACLDGAVCWYSIIHTPLEHLDAAFVEMLRVLRPGAQLLVAFQAGNNERVVRTIGDGEAVSLTNYRHAADDVERCMSRAGLEIHTRAVREADYAHESTPQAFILARAPKQPES
jgi:SAM-dependent methyltransferase